MTTLDPVQPGVDLRRLLRYAGLMAGGTVVTARLTAVTSPAQAGDGDIRRGGRTNHVAATTSAARATVARRTPTRRGAEL